MEAIPHPVASCSFSAPIFGPDFPVPISCFAFLFRFPVPFSRLGSRLDSGACRGCESGSICGARVRLRSFRTNGFSALFSGADAIGDGLRGNSDWAVQPGTGCAGTGGYERSGGLLVSAPLFWGVLSVFSGTVSTLCRGRDVERVRTVGRVRVAEERPAVWAGRSLRATYFSVGSFEDAVLRLSCWMMVMNDEEIKPVGMAIMPMPTRLIRLPSNFPKGVMG